MEKKLPKTVVINIEKEKRKEEPIKLKKDTVVYKEDGEVWSMHVFDATCILHKLLLLCFVSTSIQRCCS